MKIYLDMDGVLADFERTTQRLLGPDYDWKEEVEKPMWGKVGEIQNLYELLDVLPDAYKLVYFLKTWFIPKYAHVRDWGDKHFATPYDAIQIEVLTAVPKRAYFPDAVDHKREWILRRIDPDMKVNFGPYAKDKQYHCERGDILIDDSAINIEQWKARGGIGILHVNTDDTIQQLRRLYEEEMKVLILKLISGEEVLAEKSDKEVEGAVCVDRPRIMHLEPTPNGMRATLVPYVLSDVDGRNVEIRLNAIACNPIEASAEITKSYTQAVSGLTIVNA